MNTRKQFSHEATAQFLKPNTRHFLCLLLTVFTALPLFSCGSSDDNDDGNEPYEPVVENLVLRSQSISDGAEVDADDVQVLTLTYNTIVSISTAADIQLNGNRLTAVANPASSMAVDIPLQLEPGTDYTLTVGQGAFYAKDDAQQVNNRLTISFSTIAKQAPVNPDIDQTPVAATTDEALRLYSYLLGQYRQKMISSVMANVGWNTEMAEKVYNATGKYPAMNCYDFIHICFSPANWIDYTDISPVTKWTDAGGLVNLMWHFNVPKSQGSTDYTFYNDTSFKPSNVLVNGTWENKWFYSQVDKVVATLLKLQEKGIAATWRPFHEGAGNANHKQQAAWTTSWFWWGNDGAEAYKKLWVALFDYFKQKGVNNLIWVWTTQNCNGDSKSYNRDDDWYPGDEYVDIVSRDLYGYDTKQTIQEYNEIKAVYPNKMVILGECGKDTDKNKECATISSVWDGGGTWGQFMVWYGTNFCSDSWWKDAMLNENVITRDQLPSFK